MNNEDYWRQEVVSRLQQHRARRRKRTDPESSLSLELEFAVNMTTAAPEPTRETGLHFHEPPPLIVPRPEEVMPVREHEMASRPTEFDETFGEPAEFTAPEPPPELPKVLRFPRPASMSPPAARLHMKMVEVRMEEMAAELDLPRSVLPKPVLPEGVLSKPVLSEPVLSKVPMPEAPRIVYATEHPVEAEQLELLPSFDDIRLEAPQKSLTDDLEAVPHPAALRLRAMAGLVDMAIVLATTITLAYGFLRMAGFPPLPRSAFPCLLAVGGVLWTAYQYLFLVYRGKTPGMMFAGLELKTFSGEHAPLFSRQMRALSCALSVFSVGLGYGWALVDEDQLGWHDRITGTCITVDPEVGWNESNPVDQPVEKFPVQSETDLPY